MPGSSNPRRRPRVIVDSLEDSPSSSSSEDEVEEEQGGDASEAGEMNLSGRKEEHPVAPSKKAPAFTINLKKVCKVCKEKGHQAGFQGATYIDCPKKPCFLCKKPGHTTMSCPHRVVLEHGIVPAPRRNKLTLLDYVFEREFKPHISKIKPKFVVPDKLEHVLVRFHSRRVTSLEFHPTLSSVLLSGDKKGQIGIWNYDKLHERTLYDSIHSCIVNNMKFDTRNNGLLYTSSSDGTISCTDLETGIPVLLMDVNPNGWNGPATWRMLYGMDTNLDKGLVLVADNFGYLYLLDGRTKVKMGEPILIHKKGSKVVGLHCNPAQPDLLLSCGNDHFGHIWDARRLDNGSSLASLAHGRVVNSAYFSPHSGSKILTTSQDNRIRVWDSIFGNLDSPSREIVHSHDFNRHLTPFRAEWDPKDPSESLAVIGRYISENFNGVALHPIDFIDTSTGQLVAEVVDTDLTTISPVNKLHPRDDILATGSSRSVLIWRPERKDEDREQLPERMKEFIICNSGKKSSKRMFDDDSDDDFSSKRKNSQQKKNGGKSNSAGPRKGKTVKA
ncbi:Protein damaged DNA-binding 2 [Apostasia shenzhenica]|uniref:Protein damaged DNA-binding 2 n=1 Tax=Apostasia shenzhenica TaxID=1088818 RepID=A0A2I0AHR7_9ASPA|nr:Protein damaged DNA-binding 2 [Apostasia shenzhenica]